MPIKNRPGFVPRSFPFQPDYYVELFGRICAVFTHPTKKVTLYMEVDADVWNHRGAPGNASGDLVIQYQAADCRNPLVRHKTLAAALESMKKFLANEHFGESFKNPPVFTEHSHRFWNPNLSAKPKRLRRKGNGKRFVLTEQDKAVLKEYGNGEEDFPQIEEAANRSTFTVDDKDEQPVKAINVWEAIDLLGRETFLSGISRSAFHWTCSRENPETGVEIFFNSSILFKDL